MFCQIKLHKITALLTIFSDKVHFVSFQIENYSPVMIDMSISLTALTTDNSFNEFGSLYIHLSFVVSFYTMYSFSTSA